MVTTNATLLHDEVLAKTHLEYIDELILSVEAIEPELQKKISRVKIYVHWEQVLKNIHRY
jgi:wyosine [tRNA(Phe)-imidazoG37] synthetase (radical SAM superfamily)